VIEKHGIEIVEGQATFKSSTEIAVGDRILSTRFTVIATGSQPRAVPGLESDGAKIMTSDDVLKMEAPPKSIAIIGAGAIGCEFASFFQEIGCEVALIEMMDTLLPLEDVDVGKALARVFEAHGINVLTSARVLPDKTRSYDGVVELSVEHSGEEKKVAAEVVLVAVGRQAVTEGLGLENTRVTLDRGYIKAGEAYVTDDPAIYAIGDANGGLLLVHVAGAEGAIAAEAITGKPAENLDVNRVPRVTYSHPQVASVGLTERQAKEAGRNAKSARYSFRSNAMALIKNEPEGFAKVTYDADSGDLLGVHIIGPTAGELITEAALAKFIQGSAWEIAANIHPHPSLSEALGDAAQIAAGISIYRQGGG
jgi:dihydrolipoamide dehydrogenase